MLYISRLLSFIGTISIIILVIISYLAYQIINPEKIIFDNEYDAIVILSGNPQRAITGSKLYKNKYSKYILLSKEDKIIKNYLNPNLSIKTYELYTSIIVANQIDINNIILFGMDNTSTYNEAKSLRDLKLEGVHKVLIVTDKYHIYRAKTIFNNIVSRYQMDFYYDSDQIDWAISKSSLLIIFSEILKSILYYVFTDFDRYLGKI